MVTFRFYVVSTVAFFLALAVGIVIGSALDERIVQGLENQVTSVENDLDSTVETIDAKDRAIDDLEQYVEESAPFAVESQLDGTGVLIVAESGTDAGAVQDLVRRTRDAGGVSDGILWLEPRLDLSEQTDREDLADTLELSTSSAETMRGWTWSIVVEEVSERTGAPPVGGTTTSTTEPAGTATTSSSVPPSTATPQPFLDGPSITALADAGFVRVETVDGAPATAAAVERLAVVFVTDTASDLGEPGSVVTELARTEADGGVITVVASVWEETDGGPEWAAAVEPIRDDPDLSTAVSTIDDLELIAGRVATVLAVADAEQGIVGHYGYGRGAEAVVPAWTGP